MSIKIQEKDFEQIYKDTYSNTLKFVVIKCYNMADINDILQDTYIEFLKILKRKKILKLDNLENYICGIANNIIKRYYYKKHSLTIVSNENDENIPDNFELEDDFITKENVKEIWNYINKKDVNLAKIFYLYFVMDMKIVDIAKELEITESNVKNKLYRNLKELKRIFGKEDMNYEK